MLAEKSLSVLQLRDENRFLENELKGVKEDIGRLKQRLVLAPQESRRLERAIQQEESKLELLSHAEELAALTTP